jgi:hypothetical protein
MCSIFEIDWKRIKFSYKSFCEPRSENQLNQVLSYCFRYLDADLPSDGRETRVDRKSMDSERLKSLRKCVSECFRKSVREPSTYEPRGVSMPIRRTAEKSNRTRTRYNIHNATIITYQSTGVVYAKKKNNNNVVYFPIRRGSVHDSETMMKFAGVNHPAVVKAPEREQRLL